MNIVLIAPSGAVRSAIKRLALEATSDRVTVISSDAPDVGSAEVTTLVFASTVSPVGAALTRALSTSVVGRNVLRLTPLDGGRRLARAALRSAAVRDAIAQADLVAVLERDGILTGWKAMRRWARPETPVVHGAAPAETVLKAQRARH